MAFPFFGKKEKQQEAVSGQNTDMKPENEAVLEEDAVLRLENIRLAQPSVSKEEAIEMAGRLLAESGYVTEEYIPAMLEREKVLTTYMGEGVAIPHGVAAARDFIQKTGICVLQFPDGVVFGDEKAYLLVGIAGKGNEHMKILTNLAEFIMEGQTLRELFQTSDRMKIFEAFTMKL